MPSYDELYNGYYDPNQGTYISPGRVDWNSTMRGKYPGTFPDTMPPEYTSDPSYATYKTPRQGEAYAPMDFAPNNWMTASYDAGLQPPTSRELQLTQSRPYVNQTDRTQQAFGFEQPASTTGTGTPRTPEEMYRSGERDLQYQPATSSTSIHAPGGYPEYQPAEQAQSPGFGLQAGMTGRPASQRQSGFGQPQRQPGYGQPYQPGSDRQDLAQSEGQSQSWRGFPSNAAYVSTDGLVAYDEQGYRIDSIGNRAQGPGSDSGAHLFNQGYDTASQEWNRAKGWA